MHPAANFELIIGMFLVVLGLHYLARRLSLPPAAALIVGGCAVAFVPGVQGIAIDPQLVLILFLPPLLMDGACIAVGAAIGGLWVLLLRRLGDDTLMIAATVLVCWSAYIAGELLHVSGVIAVVTAGLTCGWYQHVVFTARVRTRAMALWQVLVFLLEAAVFLLIGLSFRGLLDRVGGLSMVVDTMAQPVLLIVVAVVVARFLWIFGVDAGSRPFAASGGRGSNRLARARR